MDPSRGQGGRSASLPGRPCLAGELSCGFGFHKTQSRLVGASLPGTGACARCALTRCTRARLGAGLGVWRQWPQLGRVAGGLLRPRGELAPLKSAGAAWRAPARPSDPVLMLPS